MEKEEHFLVRIGREIMMEHNHDNGMVHITGDDEVDVLLNDLEHYPHAFLLACLMDRHVKADRAWRIPYRVMEGLGDFSMSALLSKNQKDYENLFVANGLHSLPVEMSKVFYLAVHKIHDDYRDNAANIWNDTPSSATIIRRVREFYGAGPKIASMTANILARQYGIKYSDYHCIDVSVDVHVKRVMTRLGLINENATNEDVINLARELNPEYPGIIDYALWKVGRSYCPARGELHCSECYLMPYCQHCKDNK